MALSTRALLLAVLCVSLALCFLPAVRGLVFGLDFGSRWVKMSVIRGNTFEIILDAQTKRKFVNGIAFHDDERFFEAEKVMARSPHQTYLYTSQLLGKFYNSSLVEQLKPHLLYAEQLVPSESRGTVAVRYNQNTTFAVEDLSGMIFNFARETAEHYVSTPVADVVITVPPHWTAEERVAVIEAAELGGFHVLSLINDGTAVALHYAFGKKFEEPRHVVFFDMGHSNTRATLVEYHSIRIKKGAKNMTQPTMKVKAVAYDTQLGGRDLDYRLAEYLAGIAVTQMEAKGIKTTVDEIKANKRAWARLLTAATQAKTVLSANTQTYAAVEGLVGDYDLKTTVTRAQFEELCADLFARVAKPILDVLAEANMTIGEVASVEIVGGSVRVPKVQAVLKETLGLADLSKTLNGDEAAVLGAVFMAAHMSTSIQVPEHKIKDITPYGVTATLQFTRAPEETIDGSTEGETGEAKVEADDGEKDFDADGDDDDAEEDGTVTKVLSLFKPFSRVGAKKNISFRKRVSNFTVELSYDDSAAAAMQLPEDTPRGLSLIKVEDMDKLKKYNYTGKPKVTLSFRLTTSGLVELEKAEAEVVVIKYPEPERSATPTPAAENGEEEAETEAEKEGEEGADDDDDDDNEKEGAEDTEKEEQPTEEETEEDELLKKQKKKKAKEEEKKQKKEKKQEKKQEKKERKPKKTVHKVILTPVIRKLGIPERSFVEKSRAKSLLRQWEAKAASKREKADAKNDLETYIYDVKEKLWDDELEKVSTEEQRDEAREALSAAADWLEGDGLDVPTKEYRDKKAELVGLVEPIFERKEELTKRPVQVAMLSYMFNHTRSALVGITERLKVEEEERDDLLDLVEETEDWLADRVEEQEQKLPHEEPAFWSEQVQARSYAIEKALRKLLKRKPRPTPTPAAEENPAEEATASQEEATTTTTEEELLKEEAVFPEATDEDIL